MKLMLDLLLGARKHRYLQSRPFDHLPNKDRQNQEGREDKAKKQRTDINPLITV